MAETEFRVIGPPGCGKTTFLSREASKAVERYGSEQVMITSLTRTAAAEVAGRDIAINPDRIGTLHAHAFRALGFPEIAEDKKRIEQWNEETPAWKMTPPDSSPSADGDDGADKSFGDLPGDEAFSSLNRLRAMKIPEEYWPTIVRKFAGRWKEWKDAHGYYDFTDLIHHARDIWQAPGKPKVIFVDEAQDHDRLELDLVRRWGSEDRGVERLIIVGDPDQNLYEWRGSEPEAFYATEIPDSNKLTLSQSYRVPHAVWHRATEWIEKIPGRDPVEYWPTDEAGDSREDAYLMLKDSPGLLRDAEQYLAEGKSVMFLTTCAYMLEPLRQELRAAGIPFHNPYRRRADWNPLNPPVRGTATIDRFRSYVSPMIESEPYKYPWSVGEVQSWSEALVRIFPRGGRQQFMDLQPDQAFTPEMIDKYFKPDSDPYMMYNVEAGDTEWYRSHLRSGANLDYAARVLQAQGASALFEAPQIQIGTIHSVKGGEADVVYLFPDISYQGRNANLTREGANATIRQFYVGMTRAKETLILAGASSKLGVSWR